MAMFDRDTSWVEELKSKIEGKTSQSSSKWLFVPKEAGESVMFRMLPMNKDTALVYFQHWGIGDRSITCMKTFSESCPICEMLWEARKEHGINIIKYLPQKSTIISVVEIKQQGNEFIAIPEHKFLRVYKGFMDDYITFTTEGIMGRKIIPDDIKTGVIFKFTRKEDGKIKRNILSEFDLTPYLEDIEKSFISVKDFFKKPSEEDIEVYKQLTKDKIAYLVGKQSVDKSTSTRNDVIIQSTSHSGSACIGGVSIPLDKKKSIIENVLNLPITEDKIKCFGCYGSVNNCDDCEFDFMCQELTEQCKDKEFLKNLINTK